MTTDQEGGRVLPYPTARGDLRRCVEDAIESLIILLDTIDGDPDLEVQCEGEGEDSDSEDEQYACVPTYEGDLDGTGDQTRIVSYLNT